MKYIIILIHTLIYINVNGQDLTVIYDAYSYSNEIQKENGGDKIYRLSLSIKNGKSKYSRDSVILKTPMEMGEERWNYKVIYKDYSNDLRITDNAYFKDGWYHKEKLSKIIEESQYQWKETGRKKKICNLECIEVTNGYDKVFYTPEIPISDGPYTIIYNLPGLVMEYDNGTSKWIATQVTFSSDEIIMPNTNLEENIDIVSKVQWKAFMGFNAKEAISISNSSEINKWLRFER